MKLGIGISPNLLMTAGAFVNQVSDYVLDTAQPALTFADISTGKASTTDGQNFWVLTSDGNGAYKYLNVGGQAQFVGFSYTEARRTTVDSRESALTASLPVVPLMYNDGFISLSTDGRYALNTETAQTGSPTLNWLVDPFYVQNEVGGGTPTTTMQELGPNALLDASKHTYTALNQINTWIVGAENTLPTEDATFTIEMIQEGATPQTYRIGTQAATAGQKADFVLDNTQWVTVTQTLTVTGTSNRGVTFLNDGTNTAPQVAFGHNAGVFDIDAGDILPDAIKAKSAMSGHGQNPCAYRQSLVMTASGALNHGAMLPNPSVSFNLYSDMTPVTEFTMGCWLSADTLDSVSYHHGFGFDYHAADVYANVVNTDRATNLFGQIGVHALGTAATAANHDKEGKPYINPVLNTIVSRAEHYLAGEGLFHFTITVDVAGNCAVYENGVFITEDPAANLNPTVMRLIAGAYSNLRSKDKNASLLDGLTDQHYFFESALTPSQVAQMDQYTRQKIEGAGGTIGQRKAVIIGAWDSITFFAPSYFHSLSRDTNLTPRPILINEAVGGSFIDDFSLAGVEQLRLTELRLRVEAGVQSHQECWLYMMVGTNEFKLWDDADPGNTWVFDAWFARYINEVLGPIKRDFPTVKIAAFTPLPDSTQPATPNTIESYKIERERERYNQFLRDNLATVGAVATGIDPAFTGFGFDMLVDTGLGTERLTVTDGVFEPHPVAGGTLMGNYRTTAGCFDQGGFRPAATIPTTVTADLTDPAAVIFTAAAGTFLQIDVGRRLTGVDGGIGRISSVNGDGSVAIVDSTNEAPTPRTNEPVALLDRDTIVRAPFVQTSFAADELTNLAEIGYFGIDGVHPDYAGGRIICDAHASPATQAIHDAIG